MKFSYNWLQSFFDKPLPNPDDIETRVGLYAFEPEGVEHVDEDTVFDFDVLPNRAHDCLSHAGLARELAVLFSLKQTNSRYPDIPDIDTSDLPLSVEVKDTTCRRYIGRVIEGVTVTESPDWLQERLRAIGQRPINNIVDATNYVMFDLGQPLHAFDYGKVTEGSIIVRRATKDETITLLSGEEKVLSENQLVIADPKHSLAVAGVKGGNKAEVNNATTSIILEAANFDPVTTRTTARTLKIQTDSSKRFENEITPTLAEQAIEAVTALIISIAGTDDTKLGRLVDQYPSPHQPWTIEFDTTKIAQVLGVAITNETARAILEQLGCKINESGNTWRVTPPLRRLDLTVAEDLIEEIGRIYGYENIPTLLPNNPKPAIHKETYYSFLLRRNLIEKGYSEIMTYTFCNQGDVVMANALASDKDHLRTTLLDGFTESLEKNLYNAELLGSDTVHSFEIGTVFPSGEQKLQLAIGYASSHKKYQVDLRNLVQELGEATGLDLLITEETPQAVICNLTQAIANAKEPTDQKEAGIVFTPDQRKFHPISSYPFVLRDIAVWLPADTSPDDLLTVITKHTGDLLARTPRLFDRYEKDGRISYAYRIVFQSQEKTLTDTEVNEIMQKINRDLEDHGWEIR